VGTLRSDGYPAPVPVQAVEFQDDFWAKRIQLIRDVVLPYQWDALNDDIPGVAPSHAIQNFLIAAGEAEGSFGGLVFQDSDLAKWLEAVAYSLAAHPDPELEELADQVIDLIEKAQREDGYLNTYFILAEPEKRWTNLRDWHELYCAGHMMEAAVAYYEATGKRRFLDVMCRFADHIDSVFGTEPGKKRGYPGHPEIELALIKLYRAVGDERYLKLSKYFIDERGKQPYYFEEEAKERGDRDIKGYWGKDRHAYYQAHLPVREQKTAVGHAVRALYLYSGMADVAMETGDEELLKACRTLWDNVTKKRMYVTGGVGSTAHGEAFTIDYDLPNDTAYAETCASIALVFFAQRMLRTELNGEYGDVLERALYNGVLSGISLDGKKFFYVNPLEVWPEVCRHRNDLQHVKVTRQGWFGCACCPPNIARLLASLGSYVYSADSRGVYVHLYAGSTAKLQVGGRELEIIQKTSYPWDGYIEITVNPKEELECTLAFRIPGWCRQSSVKVNGREIDLAAVTQKGYARISRTWKPGDKVEIDFSMPIERMQAHPGVRENAGKVALQRGPIVYCLEEEDNGPNLSDICLPRDSELIAEFDKDLLGGVVVIKGSAFRSADPFGDDRLYRPAEAGYRQVEIKAIPYSTWANRSPGEMLVWIRQC